MEEDRILIEIKNENRALKEQILRYEISTKADYIKIQKLEEKIKMLIKKHI